VKTFYCPCGAWLLKTENGKVAKAQHRCFVLGGGPDFFIEGAGTRTLAGRSVESLKQTTIRCKCGQQCNIRI
jgi:hypothetical protein